VDSLLYILGKVISIVNNGESNINTGGRSSDSKLWRNRIYGMDGSKDKGNKRMSLMELNLVERRNVGGQITSRTRSR
jgi:hypothetical protein